MHTNYVVQETTVRETGESAVFSLGENFNLNLLLTLGITHATERESLDLDIHTSSDGKSWSDAPAVSFRQKFYCGTYEMDMPASDARFVKVVWRLSRWGRGAINPFFRFYLTAEPVQTRVLAGVA